MSTPDPRVTVELDVMNTVYRELKRLNTTERQRAMRWVDQRLAADSGQKRAETPDDGQ